MYRYHRIVGTMVANHWKPSFPMVDCLKNHWKTIGPNGWAGNHSINGNGDHKNYWCLAMVRNFLLSFLVEAEIKQKKCCYICALTHRNNWEHHFWYPGTIFFSKIHHILIYRSLGALRAPTSSWRPFGPALGPSGLLDFVLRALRALRPCDPRPHLSRVYTQANTITWYPWCTYPWCTYP